MASGLLFILVLCGCCFMLAALTDGPALAGMAMIGAIGFVVAIYALFFENRDWWRR